VNLTILRPETVRSRLTQNAGSRTLAGFIYDGNQRYFIRTASEFTEVRDIENIVMAPGPILLRDVAEVSFGVDQETTISRVNGKDAISVTATKASQANIIDLSHRCMDLIDELNEQLRPKEVQIVVQRNLADTMEANINQIINLALIGGLLAVFVLWIFLKDLRLISVVTVSIPISVFTAFNLFYGAGISINSLTLVGMALAVGMLLDNSIVVLENIYRLVNTRMSKEEAVTKGVSGVAKAIIASTLTTATVFIPFLFFGNYMISLIGKHIGVSIISTLTMSLLVALLLIPVLAAIVLGFYSKKGNISFGKSQGRKRIERLYLVFLKSSLRNPPRVIIGGLLLFFITTFAVLAVNIDALEEVESDQIDVYVTMPKGSTLDKTDKVVREVEAKIAEIAEKEDVNSRTREEDAVVTVKLKEDFGKIDDRSFYDIKSEIEGLTKNIGDAEISLSANSSGEGAQVGGGMGDFGQVLGFGNNQEKVIVKGEDYDLLLRVSQDLLYYIQNLEDTRSASLSTRGNRPEVLLNFDPLTMARNNISPENIAVALRDFGQQAPTNTRFKYGNEEYDIIIRESEKEQKDYQSKTLADLRKLEVADQQGGLHELSSFSSIRTGESSDDIQRINQQKQIEIFYSPLSPGYAIKRNIGSLPEQYPGPDRQLSGAGRHRHRVVRYAGGDPGFQSTGRSRDPVDLYHPGFGF
jgi:multidrug efflux pump subunit AcrB